MRSEKLFHSLNKSLLWDREMSGKNVGEMFVTEFENFTFLSWIVHETPEEPSILNLLNQVKSMSLKTPPSNFPSISLSLMSSFLLLDVTHFFSLQLVSTKILNLSFTFYALNMHIEDVWGEDWRDLDLTVDQHKHKLQEFQLFHLIIAKQCLKD